MADNKNPFSFDWSSLEKWFGDSAPFMKEMIKSRATNNESDASWVEGYVRDILKGSAVKPGKTQAPEHELIETHNDIIVKLRVPDKTSPRSLRVQVSGHALKIFGLPGGKTRTISLPKNVLGESSKAIFQKGVLKIRMPKNFDGDFFNEVKIKIR